jgi:hypothetical protein
MLLRALRVLAPEVELHWVHRYPTALVYDTPLQPPSARIYEIEEEPAAAAK